MSEEIREIFQLEDLEGELNGDSQSLPADENASSIGDTQWINELRNAMERGCDLGSIRNIAKCRPLPVDLRLPIWKICLNIDETNSEYHYVDNDVFDLLEQSVLREDIARLMQNSSDDENTLRMKMNDVEAVITYYCKHRKETYEKGNGWIEIFKPLMMLPYKNRAELYAMFASISNRYIPRDCEADGMPYHLFRLLLLYHDPELCSFFDTRKITSDLYAHAWIRSLYAGSCLSDVVLPLWDSYFQYADQFFAFFLALVLLMFAKEQLLEMKNKEKHEIINFLSKAPSNLTVDDLDDFCSLANHYASNTPQSFRKEFCSCLFNDIDRSFSQKAYSIYQALCLPVSVHELLQANQLGGTAGVRYFIVDCRPADQYNAKHLCTAFHLDANLLLEDPEEFAGTVDALFATQKNAIEAGSTAAGEHLCFMGSGHEEEDKYLRMVVSYFLRRNTKYISIASGGFQVLSTVIEDPSMLVQAQAITTRETDTTSAAGSMTKQNPLEKMPSLNTQNTSFRNMLSNAMKKSLVVKDKMKDYISYPHFTDSSNSAPRHVSKQDKVGKLYRQNPASVFSLDGDDDDDELASSSKQSNVQELVDIESWFLRNDLLYKYQCEHYDENDKRHPSLLLVSATHLYILRKLPEHKKMGNLVSRRLLSTITKITSKKNIPEIITFRYANELELDDDDEKVFRSSPKRSPSKASISFDKVYLGDAGDATKNIKILIMKILNLDENDGFNASK